MPEEQHLRLTFDLHMHRQTPAHTCTHACTHILRSKTNSSENLIHSRDHTLLSYLVPSTPSNVAAIIIPTDKETESQESQVVHLNQVVTGGARLPESQMAEGEQSPGKQDHFLPLLRGKTLALNSWAVSRAQGTCIVWVSPLFYLGDKREA